MYYFGEASGAVYPLIVRGSADSTVAAICALIARREGAIPVSQAARFFGRDESTLVRQTLRLENDAKTDRELRDRLRKLASALD